MSNRRNRLLVLLAIALAVVAGGAWYAYEQSKVCCAFPDEPEPVAAFVEDRPKLGLMTSLPLYWPLGLGIDQITSGQSELPWQRKVLEQRFELVPLDTLSPIAGLSPDEPETDPLAGLDYLAVIQPRGLSPADNVALDDWVRDGGQLLLVLDPMLTGEYDVPLGDPARPVDMALIPPVVSRWGLAGSFNETQPSEVGYAELPKGRVPLHMWGGIRVVVVDGGLNGCRTHESKAIASCNAVGKGTVTYLHDAAVFEHRELVGEKSEAVQALLSFAFD